jgi:DNA-binding SARP family transcriptional activator
MARLALTLLGGFQARLGAGPPLTLPTKKIQALLAYLALPPGREHARDKLAVLLWGDLSQATPATACARRSLRFDRPWRRSDQLACVSRARPSP